MGSVLIYPPTSDSIQSYLDRYMPENAGRIVRPDEIFDLCGDPAAAQDELKRWQSRHNDVSDQMDLGNGKIGVKVYYSAKDDPELEIIERNFRKRAERRRGRK